MKRRALEFLECPKKVLLVKTHAIGDTILITPAIKAIRDRYPQAEIVLLTGRLPGEIIKGNSDVDEIISFDESVLFTPRPFQIVKLIKEVRKRKFDMVFVFQYSFFIHTFVKAFGIPFSIGFDHRNSGFLLTRKVPWDRTGKRWVADVHLDLARVLNIDIKDKSLKIEVSDGEMKFAYNFLKINKVSSDDLIIGIFPGGGKNSRDTVYQKRWNIENYARVISVLILKYKARVIVFGSGNDWELIEKLIEFSGPGVINACGKLNLKQLSAVIKKCSLLLTNDSAPLHIACAVDTPTISLFGPSRASALVNQTDKHIAIQSSYPCSPCYSNSVFPGCRDPKCMESISYDEVLSAIEKLLNKLKNGT